MGNSVAHEVADDDLQGLAWCLKDRVGVNYDFESRAICRQGLLLPRDKVPDDFVDVAGR